MWMRTARWQMALSSEPISTRLVEKGGKMQCFGTPKAFAGAVSTGGFSTKIHALVDTLGKPLHIELTPGQRHEASVAEELICHAQGKYFLADTAYDGQHIRDAVEAHGMEAVIRPHPSRKCPSAYDKQLYKERHLVEIFFNRVKNFRRLATRFEKTARNYLAIVHIACIMEWLF